MSIIYCSKPQQNDAVTPTPLAHRSHACMRALASGHDILTSDNPDDVLTKPLPQQLFEKHRQLLGVVP